MQDPLKDRIKRIMADILNIPEERIGEGTSVENTASWDSANHIQLAVALEEEFDVQFDIKELEAIRSYDHILSSISAKAR